MLTPDGVQMRHGAWRTAWGVMESQGSIQTPACPASYLSLAAQFSHPEPHLCALNELQVEGVSGHPQHRRQPWGPPGQFLRADCQRVGSSCKRPDPSTPSPFRKPHSHLPALNTGVCFPSLPKFTPPYHCSPPCRHRILLPDAPRSTLKTAQPFCSTFVPGHLEFPIVTQATRQSRENGVLTGMATQVPCIWNKGDQCGTSEPPRLAGRCVTVTGLASCSVLPRGPRGSPSLQAAF